MSDPNGGSNGGSGLDQAKAIADTVDAIAKAVVDVKAAIAAVNPPLSCTMTVLNDSDETVSFKDASFDHGAFMVHTPPGVIGPGQAAVFAVGSKEGSLWTGTQGTMTWEGEAVTFTMSFDVPYVSAPWTWWGSSTGNSANITADGSEKDAFKVSSSITGGGISSPADARYEIHSVRAPKFLIPAGEWETLSGVVTLEVQCPNVYGTTFSAYWARNPEQIATVSWTSLGRGTPKPGDPGVWTFELDTRAAPSQGNPGWGTVNLYVQGMDASGRTVGPAAYLKANFSNDQSVTLDDVTQSRNVLHMTGHGTGVQQVGFLVEGQGFARFYPPNEELGDGQWLGSLFFGTGNPLGPVMTPGEEIRVTAVAFNVYGQPLASIASSERTFTVKPWPHGRGGNDDLP